MGNCLAPESRRTPRSRAQRTAVVPVLNLHADEPEKGRPPVQAADHEPSNIREKAAAAAAAPRYSKPSVRFADEEDDRKKKKKEPVRVKVVMTKKEAARLLSMLASADVDGNATALQQAENMLCELEGGGGGGGGSSGCACSPNRVCWRPALESIPEN